MAGKKQKVVTDKEVVYPNQIANYSLKKDAGKANLGLTAVSFAIFLSLLQVQVLDFYLIVCLICFCIVFPSNFLCGFYISFREESLVVTDGTKQLESFIGYINAITISSGLLALIGLVSLICHFSWIIGLSFFVVSIISFLIFSHYLPHVK